jgi:NADH-quinone oxidoreductase subunit F
VYEIPFGVTLRELLEMAGGIRDGHKLQAILFGGAAGAFATPEQLDVKLTFEDLRTAGLPLGSGVVVVFDDSRDLRNVLKGLGHFFAYESCGKCYPCQMGTQRQKEILERVAAGKSLPGDIERLQDVGWTMTDASLCGLGQTAAGAVLSAIRLWPAMFVASEPKAARTSEMKAAAAKKMARKKVGAKRSGAGRASRASKGSEKAKKARKPSRR